jgi:hypothetical protein
MTICEFLCAEDGVATVDWIVLLAGLTALGVWMWANLGDGTLREHSYAMRGELQDPHFQTDWFDHVAVLPPSMQ